MKTRTNRFNSIMEAGIVGKESRMARTGMCHGQYVSLSPLKFSDSGGEVGVPFKFQGVNCLCFGFDGVVPDDEMFKVPELCLSLMTVCET